MTALLWASFGGHLPVVRELVNVYKTDLFQKNKVRLTHALVTVHYNLSYRTTYSGDTSNAPVPQVHPHAHACTCACKQLISYVRIIISIIATLNNIIQPSIDAHLLFLPFRR